MKEINSQDELQSLLSKEKKTWLLIWKKGSEQSECAFQALHKASDLHPGFAVAAYDTGSGAGIHKLYSITTAPSLLVFEGTELRNVVKGCHAGEYYSGLLEEAAWRATAEAEGKPAKSVTVYTTPTCSWCTTLKQWLRKNHVLYHEIDISRDENAARELVRRSGQQGVPQTEIDGRIVVGFDQSKLKQLLQL